MVKRYYFSDVTQEIRNSTENIFTAFDDIQPQFTHISQYGRYSLFGYVITLTNVKAKWSQDSAQLTQSCSM